MRSWIDAATTGLEIDSGTEPGSGGLALELRIYTLIVLSSEPDTRRLPSGLRATLVTLSECPPRLEDFSALGILHLDREAQVVLEDWRCEYNDQRPHSSLVYLTPSECAASCRITFLATPCAPTGLREKNKRTLSNPAVLGQSRDNKCPVRLRQF